MKRGILVTLIIIIAAIMVLVGCTPAPTTTAPTTTAPTTSPSASTPQYGGTWKILIPILSAQALGNPWQQPGEYNLLRPLEDTVLNYDAKGKIVPWLATDWKYGPDAKTLTLTLRQGVKFHDGTDFNAEALKWNLDQYVAAKRGEFVNIASVDVVDNYVVQINFKQQDGGFLNTLAWCTFIVSPTAYSKNGGADGNRWKPVGTGPFKFVSWEATVALKVTKFDGYWQKGKPYLDGIEIIGVADVTVAAASLIAREAHTLLDSRGSIDPKILGDKQKDFVATLAPDAVMILAGDSAHADSPFHDIRVRQALSYAIDNKSLVDALGMGKWEATNQLFSPSNPNYNPAVVGYPHNTQKAKELLAQAGYPNGVDCTLYCIPLFQQQFTAVQAQLVEAGIRAKLEILDTQALMPKVLLPGWNKGIAFTSIQSSPAVDSVSAIRNRLSSKAAMFQAGLTHPSDLDSKIDQAAAELDPQKRVALTHELQKMVIDQYCLVNPLFEIRFNSWSYPEVKDSNLYGPVGTPCWNPENTWLSK